jgi:diguanylate cyclase
MADDTGGVPPVTPPGLLESLFRHAGVGIAVVDREGRVARANPALERMSGYSAAELRSMVFDEITHPDDIAADRELFRELLEGSRSEYRINKRYRRKDGRIVRGQLTVSLLSADDGSSYALGIVEDVTERVAAQEALERERAYLEHLFDSSPEGVVLVDEEDRVVRINPAFTGLFGYEPDEVTGRRLGDLIIPADRSKEALSVTRRISDGERVRMDTVRRRKDGGLVEVSVSGAPVRFAGRDIAVYGIYQDISERKSLERALRRASTTDELTGVLNRRGFLELAEREWRLARRRSSEMLLVYLDLDGFKEINDRYGHAEGDRVLRTTGTLIANTVRDTDLVARMGGDEFVALAVDASTEEALVGRIESAVAHLNEAGDLRYPLSVSIGAVLIPARSVASVEALLAEADHRMYSAKRRRKSARNGQEHASE